MRLFPKGIAKKGSAIRVAGSCLLIILAIVILYYTASGIAYHEKMYLGPKYHRGIIIYYARHPFGFSAAAVFNCLFSVALLYLSTAEIRYSIRRKRRADSSPDSA
ncbi:MAG: hypothetical protein PHC88_00150 [Terrimicrobiaceae bacterium]|nr:hypothetical protein [Terrimicrobiaceae bacterium]